MTVYTLDFFNDAETIEFDETLLETFQKLNRLFNKKMFLSMKSNCIFINISRGKCVNTKDLIIRQVTDDLSQARTPVTGKREFRLLGYSKDPQVTISQSAPLALQVNSLIAEVTF